LTESGLQACYGKAPPTAGLFYGLDTLLGVPMGPADPQDRSELSHPLFARFFDRFSRSLERELGPLREELLAGLSGRVLELGAGNGLSFQHYPSTVDEVVAIEPEPYMRAKAQRAAARASVPVLVRTGLAGQLDLQPGSFNAAVCSQVLCSVPDQHAALQELRRALRPGGQLRFLEHVGGHGIKARAQRTVDASGIWPRMFGGCHCGRDTVGMVRAAGFEMEKLTPISVGPPWLLSNPHVLGTAQS
jgi:SAM-dependent methyltransferase